MDQHPLQLSLAYQDLIAATLTNEPFYARSFRCDPLATARLLLSWRDSLNEAGWHAGLDHGDTPPRLQAPANLESAFRDKEGDQFDTAGNLPEVISPIRNDSHLFDATH